MVQMNWAVLWSLPIAYLLGSIPSAFIVARFNGGLDLRDEADGKISAAAVYRRVGLLSFLLVVIMDIGKAALAALIAQWIKAPMEIVLLTGVCAIAGHQWSIFLKFQGGLGATTIGGVLVAIATVPTVIGAAIAAVLYWKTKNSTYSFVIGVSIILIIIFAMQFSQVLPPPIFISFPPPPLLVAFPAILVLMMAIKALQIKYRPGATIKAK
jgi:acyl phosphate:glycerol-3-phosphate acyltransferase